MITAVDKYLTGKNKEMKMKDNFRTFLQTSSLLDQ